MASQRNESDGLRGVTLKNRCSAETLDGRPCPAARLRGSQRCFTHDTSSEVVARRAAANRRGGLNRRRYVKATGEGEPIRTVEQIQGLMLAVLNDLKDRRIDIRTGCALAFAARIALLSFGECPGQEYGAGASRVEHLALAEIAQMAQQLGPRHGQWLAMLAKIARQRAER